MLALVVGIWGYVGLQLVGGTGGDEDILPEEEFNPNENPVINMGKNEKLLLNYSDPFLKEEVRPVSVPVVKKTNVPAKTESVKKEEKPAPPAYTWPHIVYKGLIQNKTHPDKLVGVIVINGQERIIRKGERLDELSVASIERNKVELEHEKEKKIFVK